jgi:flavin reductase (DIM6/NTAB) family NADH-FMN oxidoreductase RutF
MHDYLNSPVADGPVALLIASEGPRVNAMTVRFFSEVAHHPVSLWVSVARASYTHELIEKSCEFTLAMLHDGQAALALECGGASGRERDKSLGDRLYKNANGHLFLHDAFSSTACRVRQRIALGDHSLLIADILEGNFDSRNFVLRRHLLVSDLASNASRC